MHYKVLIRVATSRGLVRLGHGTPLGGDTGVARFCQFERKAGEGVNGVYTTRARSQKDIQIQYGGFCLEFEAKPLYGLGAMCGSTDSEFCLLQKCEHCHVTVFIWYKLQICSGPA